MSEWWFKPYGRYFSNWYLKVTSFEARSFPRRPSRAHSFSNPGKRFFAWQGRDCSPWHEALFYVPSDELVISVSPNRYLGWHRMISHILQIIQHLIWWYLPFTVYLLSHDRCGAWFLLLNMENNESPRLVGWLLCSICLQNV